MHLLCGGNVDRIIPNNSIAPSNSVIPYVAMEKGYVFEMDVHAQGTNFLNQNFGFYLLSKNNLNDAAWTTNMPAYAITGDTTRVCFTNYNPCGFFKVVESPRAVPTE